MKKDDCSVVYFSDIDNVTTDYKKIKTASDQMKMYGMMSDDGNADENRIRRLVSSISVPFFSKLERRVFRREGGISEIFLNYSMMVERKEYIAAYFYLTFLYGLSEWRVPEEVRLIPADDDVLKCFVLEFGKMFSSKMEELIKISESDREVTV